jgi:hypothetical protein
MTIRTLLRYLIGDRQAILTLAVDRRALWLGFLFVLSAGFAREYDGEDLLHEPWHLLIPAAASLATSFLLFLITDGLVRAKHPAKPGMGSPPSFFAAYRMFLTLFWLTAPLAWLYAIPYERFLSAVGATQANLWTLGLVALWRVALMVRVVSVLMGYQVLAALCLVMTLADIEALFALQFVPVPIIDVMGGIRLTESERLMKSAAMVVLQGGICSLPIWLIGTVWACVVSKPAWQVDPAAPGKSSRSWPMWALACGSLAIWTVILPFTQPEQILKRRVEQQFAAGQIAAALAEMSAHSPDDFPPHWDPPPKPSFGLTPVLEVLEAMAEEPPAPWVQSLYLAKLRLRLGTWYLHDEELIQAVKILKRIPESHAWVERLPQEEDGSYRRLKEMYGASEPN